MSLKPEILIFKDYPEFRPNLKPEQIYRLGSFGGTYWRDIKSKITNKEYKNSHLEFPKSWWKDLEDSWLTNKWENYDKSINKYGVKVGTTLRFWEEKKWINKEDPYGWVQWYCRFYEGRRIPKEDERQIKRWKGVASNNSRFKNRLINMIIKKGGTYDDYTISPKIRQTLQHWGYQLTKEDLNKEIKKKQKENKEKKKKKKI
mgnify:FL=1|tara:strand:+ start:183 stop:788 length:606 start_codon:yes stop_codon:yes gene_type:complete